MSIGCLPTRIYHQLALRVASRSDAPIEDENCHLRCSTQKYVKDIVPSSTHRPQTLRKQWYPVANGRIAESLSRTNRVGAKWMWVVMNIYTIFSVLNTCGYLKNPSPCGSYVSSWKLIAKQPSCCKSSNFQLKPFQLSK